jgi:hypothetical protein
MKNEPQELRELLSRLPDAPVSSNFTARVMQAVELEELQAATPRTDRPQRCVRDQRAAAAQRGGAAKF